MRLTELRVSDLRILQEVALQPGPGLNFVAGPNGSGKTSLLEGIYLLSRGRSFRTRATGPLVRRGAPRATVFGRFSGLTGRSGMAVGVEKGRGGTRIHVDGERVRSVAGIARELPVMVVAPEGLGLVLGGAEERRTFLDWVMFHVEPDYMVHYRKYQRALRQRNAALRAQGSPGGLPSRGAGVAGSAEPAVGEGPGSYEIWEEALAEAGAELHRLRVRHVRSLGARFASLLERFDVPALGWTYVPGWNHPGEEETEGAVRSTLAAALRASRGRDVGAGFTTLGPHRGDLACTAAGAPAREVLSRGQGRIAVMVLQVAAACHVEERTGHAPLLLVDDLAAELDGSNAARMLETIEATGHQAFVTTVRPETLGRGPVGGLGGDGGQARGAMQQEGDEKGAGGSKDGAATVATAGTRGSGLEGAASVCTAARWFHVEQGRVAEVV